MMMKMVVLIVTLLFSFAAMAQQSNAPQMQQKIIEQLQTMDPMQLQQQVIDIQKCIGDNQAGLKKLEKEGQKLGKRIQKLCQDGKRNEAQSYAMKEGKRFMAHPTIQRVSQCGKGLMQQVKPKVQSVIDNKQHVCDQKW